MIQIEQINVNILKACREQMMLDIEEVKKMGISSIKKMEAGEKTPTYEQLGKLADLYNVPDWVFISKTLPKKFQLQANPSFRLLAKQTGVEKYKIRKLIAKVESFRELILEFNEYAGQPFPPYSQPEYNNDPEAMAKKVRKWLAITKPLGFKKLKQKLESKGVFVFLTSKYQSWSKIDIEDFRGLALYKDILPIIIINDSDAKKAQSFTLFHELGHLLKKNNILDGVEKNTAAEKRCNIFAGNMLMPKADFLQTFKQKYQPINLENIEKLAKHFQVSSYACVVRLSQLRSITQEEYNFFETSIKEKIRRDKEKLKEKKPPINRNISQEAFQKYGGIYARAVWQAYYDNEIGLHKLCKLFELKRVSYALKMKELL